MTHKEDEITFFVFADEFFAAAEELEKSTNPAKVATASYYLYGHALELAYKSYLHWKGLEIKELKRIGHDLELALEKCIGLGIDRHMSIDDAYHDAVKGLNKYYSTKEFEYMTKVAKTFPHLQDVKTTVKKTINMAHHVLTMHLQ